MRLTPEEIQLIRDTTAAYFGPEARVWLFGSRVDDQARGGDIDLMVDTPNTLKTPFADTVALETALQLVLGDQKIDILLKHGGNEDTAFHQMARSTGVLL